MVAADQTGGLGERDQRGDRARPCRRRRARADADARAHLRARSRGARRTTRTPGARATGTRRCGSPTRSRSCGGCATAASTRSSIRARPASAATSRASSASTPRSISTSSWPRASTRSSSCRASSPTARDDVGRRAVRARDPRGHRRHGRQGRVPEVRRRAARDDRRRTAHPLARRRRECRDGRARDGAHQRASRRPGCSRSKRSRPRASTPAQIVIAHAGDSNDLGYLRAIADTGASLGCDRFSIEHFNPDAKRIETLAALVAEGYAGSVHLGHDAACFYDFMFRQPALRRREARLPAHLGERLPAAARGGRDTGADRSDADRQSAALLHAAGVIGLTTRCRCSARRRSRGSTPGAHQQREDLAAEAEREHRLERRRHDHEREQRHSPRSSGRSRERAPRPRP